MCGRACRTRAYVCLRHIFIVISGIGRMSRSDCTRSPACNYAAVALHLRHSRCRIDYLWLWDGRSLPARGHPVAITWNSALGIRGHLLALTPRLPRRRSLEVSHGESLRLRGNRCLCVRRMRLIEARIVCGLGTVVDGWALRFILYVLIFVIYWQLQLYITV